MPWWQWWNRDSYAGLADWPVRRAAVFRFLWSFPRRRSHPHRVAEQRNSCTAAPDTCRSRRRSAGRTDVRRYTSTADRRVEMSRCLGGVRTANENRSRMREGWRRDPAWSSRMKNYSQAIISRTIRRQSWTRIGSIHGLDWVAWPRF